MGQLGNYIHYRARNYRDSGINHKGQSKGVTAAQALNEQHQHIKQKRRSSYQHDNRSAL